jgi:hypothetical protein
LLFGWLCLLAELSILQRSTTHMRALWALPPLFAVWINTHGSWMIGLVVYVVFTAANAVRVDVGNLWSPGMQWPDLRRRILVLVLSVLALFVNPYGWRLVVYPFDLAFRQKLNVANVQEWHTIDLHTPRGKLVLVSMVLLAIWQIVRPRRWKLADLLLVLLGVYSGFTYSRFLFLLALLAVPSIAATLSLDNAPRQEKNRGLLNAAGMLFLLAMVWSSLHHRQGPDPRAGQPLPVDFGPAVAALPPSARVFNEYTWGGRLIWTNHLPVFVDSRVDIFEYNGTFKDYLDIVHLNNSLDLLDKHRITHVLFPADAPLVYLLQNTSRWKTIEQRDGVVLLARSPAL